MQLYILNKNLELKGIIDSFTSLIWTRKYYKSGEFELTLAATKENRELLIKDNIIYRDESIEAGFIETIEIDENNGIEKLKVRGKFLTYYFSRRINWGQLFFKGKIEELMRKLVNDSCISPSNIDRKIPLLSLGEINNYTESIEYQNSYGNINSELEKLSNLSNIAFRNKVDISNRKIIFEAYKGVDRSVNQTLIAPCIFSREFENIFSQAYTDSINNLKNTALVGGEGEGTARTLISINDTNVGLGRHELFVDAKDLQKDVDGVILTDEEYKNTLIARGNEKLAENNEVKTFDSKVNTRGNNIYKVDYDLGDIVTIVDTKWGLQLDTRITEIEEVYEENGLEINPTFGNSIPTIIDKIKSKMR